MKRRLNILVAIESFYDGGAEMFAIRLANEMAICHNVIFLEVFPYRSRNKRQKKVISPDIQIIHLGKNFLGDLLHKGSKKNFLKKKLLALYNHQKYASAIDVVKKNKIDIVHSHSWESDLYFSKIKYFNSFKIVSTLHGHYEQMKIMFSWFTKAATPVLDAIDAVVYSSEAQEETLTYFHFSKEKRYKIPHGIDINTATSPTVYKSKEVLRCFMVGRGIREKGWEEMILAVIMLEKLYPRRIHLSLVGEGDFLEQMKQKYPAAPLSFLGYRDDVSELIKEAHLCLLPSYSEHFPLVIVEYLVSGKPVIASNVGAVNEMMSSGKATAGFLVEVDNAPNPIDISNAVQAYLINPDLVERHSRTAIMAAQKFSIKSCSRSYSNVYKEVMYLRNVQSIELNSVAENVQ